MNNRTKTKSGQAPTLTPDTLGGLVFKIAGWQSMQGALYNTLPINRIEDVRQVMKFPMPPHRKTVIDFIFITHGSMIRQNAAFSARRSHCAWQSVGHVGDAAAANAGAGIRPSEETVWISDHVRRRRTGLRGHY